MKKPARLKEITLKYFRGASQPVTIPFSDLPITLFFGENGTGKSSIIDGLDFALNGEIGSLGGMSGANISHLPTLNSKSSDVSVSVDFSDGSQCQSFIKGRNIITNANNDPQRPYAAILRRANILSAVTAKPTERYEALANYIDVRGIESTEAAIGKALNAEKSKHDDLQKKFEQAEIELMRLFEEHASIDEKNLGHEQWAAAHKDQDTTEIKKTVKALADVIAAFSATEDAQREAELRKAAWQKKHEEQLAAEEGYKAAIKNNPDAVDLLIELLNAGKLYLGKIVGDIDKCPLCNNQTNREKIASTIEKKLSALPEVQAAKQRLNHAIKITAQEKTYSRTSYARLLKCVSLLIESIKALPENQKTSVGLDGEFAELCDLPTEVAQEHVNKKTMSLAHKFIDSIKSEAPKWKKMHDDIEPKKILLTSIQSQYKALLEKRKEAKKTEKVRDHLKDMLILFQSQRQTFVQNILESVSEECDRIYKEIHRDEPLGGIRILLDEKKRAACNMNVHFYGKDAVPPQAYYSESHMDTLGFSVFLALAKRNGGNGSIVVLDDIFTSVDDQHLGRVFQFLCDESSHFSQIIITTHSRKILNWIKSGHLPQKVFGPIELCSRWTLKDGIQVAQTTLCQDEIKHLLELASLDRNNLAGKSRHHLEALTRNLAFELGASGKMKKNGDYELADYLDGVGSVVRKEKWKVRDNNLNHALCFQEEYDFHGQIKTLSSSKIILNKLVHDTDEDAEFTDRELREFASKVLKMDEYLRCSDCGSLVGSNKKLKACSCGKKFLQQVP